MGTWQVVGTSWKVTVKSLGVAGFVTGCYLLFGLLGLPLSGQGVQASVGQALLGLGFLSLYFFIWPLIQGGCLSFVDTRLAQSSVSPSIASWWQGARKLYGRLLGFLALWTAAFLMWGMVFGIVFVVALAIGSAAQQMTASIIMTLIACIVGGIALYPLIIVSAMAPVAMAVEGGKIFQAITKGWQVGRAMLGRLLLVSLALILTLVPGIILNVLPVMLQGGGAKLGVPGQLIGLVMQSIISALSLFLFSTAYVQLYRSRAGVLQASQVSA